MYIFSGIYKNRRLESPKGQVTRPTSGRMRETLFNICQQFIEGSKFLDLFAGSGAMGLEALSRGASHSTLVDNHRDSLHCIQANVKLLKVESNSNVIFGDVFDQLSKLGKKGSKFDIIFADPPYETPYLPEAGYYYSTWLLKLIDEQLNSGIQILTPGGALFIEESSHIAFDHLELKHLKLKNSRQTGKTALHYFTFDN